MTATDELRRMLDERGVEHEDDEDVTRFFGPDGFEVVMQGDIDGKLDCLTPLYLTPAQAIADRIDAEYQEAVASVTNDALYYANDKDMAECGWIRLPKDADGEYIQIGDVMVYADGNTCPLPVVALVPPAVFLTDDGPRYADMCRHYHASAFEDMIRDAILQCVGHSPEYWGEPIAECAAKLRLAGDE